MSTPRKFRNSGVALVLQVVVDPDFSSITRSKPTAFQAVSFKQFWMRMGGWKNIGEERIRSTTSNITSYGSRSTATRCYGAGWQKRVRNLIRQSCEARGVAVIRGAVSPDHVHMLVTAPPQLAPSKLVQYLKGRSSRRLQDEFGELRKRYWGQHLWARGYFCATVGAVDEETIKRYIESQKWDEDGEGFKITPELCTDSLCECGCVRSGLAVVVRW